MPKLNLRKLNELINLRELNQEWNIILIRLKRLTGRD